MQCLEIPHLKLDMVANSGQCFRMKALDADTYSCAGWEEAGGHYAAGRRPLSAFL